MFLSNNESALLIAIFTDCTVEEAFERLIKPDFRFNLKKIDYIDISNLVASGISFSEIALIYNRKESNIKYSYYRVIEKYGLYDPRPKTPSKIKKDDLILIKYMAEKNRSIEFIADRFSQYSKGIISEVYEKHYA